MYVLSEEIQRRAHTLTALSVASTCAEKCKRRVEKDWYKLQYISYHSLTAVRYGKVSVKRDYTVHFAQAASYGHCSHLLHCASRSR